MRSVPVLMYHHVLPKAGFIASSTAQFESQMRWLAENGWTTLDVETFRRYKRGETQVPKKSLLITFDDGWRNNLVYAHPILKRYGLRATLFVVTGWIDAASERPEPFEPLDHRACKQIAPRHPGRVILSWNELEKMRGVFDIHSHTHTHRDNYFETLDWAEDLSHSRERLHRKLGIESHHLCWPRGRYDETLVDLAREIGYDTLYTTERGVNLPDGTTTHIKRIGVKKEAKWLAKTLRIFSNSFSGALYAKLK